MEMEELFFRRIFFEREKRFSYDRISNELFYRNIPSFLKRESIKHGHRVNTFYAYDLFGDSTLEIITSSRSSSGKGSAIFNFTGESTSLNMENFYGDFCFDDINNDGNPDIVITNNGRLSYYLGEGGKDFSLKSR